MQSLKFPSSGKSENPSGETPRSRGASFVGAAWLASQLVASAAGPATVDLGAASGFAILAGAAVTTTGGGIIRGDVGASPISGAAIHLTAAQVRGTIYAVDAAGPAGSVIDADLLQAAKGAMKTAFNDAAGRMPTPSGPFLDPGAGDLGGLTLGAGLYKFSSTASISGSDLTLTGAADDVWIFQIASELDVASHIKVILAGGALARNVFWQVGTSATIGTFAEFKGIVLADQSITMGTSSTMDGKALAFTGGVTYNGDAGGDLTVPDAPHFSSISRSSTGAVTLVIETTPDFPLTLQTSTDLAPGSWITIATATPVTRQWTFIHDGTVATGPRRFYRAYLAPMIP